MSQKVNLVTGAFSYTGRYISQILLDSGQQVRNLTNHPDRPNNFNGQIKSYKMDLDNIDNLLEPFQNVHTLYCTYWVRFNDNYHGQNRNTAIKRAQNLIKAAKLASVQKIIYTSHTNTDINSPFAYIKGKAIVEQYIKNSGISYGFAKPCAIFGIKPDESILMNNLAYILRKLPFMAIPNKGLNPVQAVHVQDLAELCINLANTEQSLEKDAVGPEIFTFYDLVNMVKKCVGSNAILVKNLPPKVCYYLSKPLDYILQDKYIDEEDLLLLTNNLLVSHEPPTGKRKLSEWLYENRDQLGQKYLNSTNIYYK